MVNRKRNCSLSVRLSEKEREFIEKKWKNSNLHLREFLLTCIGNKQINIKPGGTEIVVQIKRIGNNLNQLTRRVHEGAIADCRTELNAVRDELAMLREEWQ